MLALRLIMGFGVVTSLACGSAGTARAFSAEELARSDWPGVVRRARGTTVTYAMWAGDEARNRFYQVRRPTRCAAAST
jgi:hypothetical protein